MTHHFDGEPPAPVSFNPEQLLQLLQAVAPLGGPHVETFQLSIKGSKLELGMAEVEALGQSLGKGLRGLTLGHCTLTAGFWEALGKALPSLHTLILVDQVQCRAADVSIFCRKRVTAGRFVLWLSPVLYKRCGGDRLQQGLKAQGVSNVTVRKYQSWAAPEAAATRQRQ
jgi:hypothetical protein